MGDRFWFFTDPGFLKAQTPAKAFGPAGAQGTDDIFRVTHWHDANADAPAIAVCDGILCAQPDGPDTLTLILKPSQAPPFEAPVVRYFIYKGVKRSSLLNGDAVLAETDSAANELTKAVAKVWFDQNGALTGSQAGLGLDRDANYPAGSTPKIFGGGELIDRLFAYPHPHFQLPPVSGGDVIGSFKADCGFQIVLNRLGYRPTLDFARSADNVISVPTITSTNGGSAWAADDAAYFAHWHAKERVLAFLDPAAYFGGFVQAELWKGPKSSAIKVKGGDIHDDLLATFANRNVAWLDVRNNYGFSYNLFGLYRDIIRFIAPGDPSQLSDLDFRGWSWPLCRLEAASVPGRRRKGLLRTLLQFPAGQAKAPLYLISKGCADSFGPERPDIRAGTIGFDTADLSKLVPIRVAFPAAKDGGNVVLTASYTRINLYERQTEFTQSPPPLQITGGNMLDGVFRPGPHRLDTNFAGDDVRFEVYPEEVLVDLSAEFGPTYAAAVGTGEDANSITLFAIPLNFLPGVDGAASASALPSWADQSCNAGTDFLSEFLARLPVVLTRRTIQPQNPPTPIDTIIPQPLRPVACNPVVDRNAVEHFCFVVLGKTDFVDIAGRADNAPAVKPAYPAFLTAAGEQTKTDTTSGFDYVETPLSVVGFGEASGKVVPVALSITPKVYRDADL